MLMVDGMYNVLAESVETSFEIKSDCIFVSDGKLTETGLIENAAQTCSAIVGKSFFDEDDTEGVSNELIGFISAIKSVQIYELPSLNQTIITKANLVSRFDSDSYSICAIKCVIKSGAVLLAESEMNLLIQEV
ncbi:MAG TPA: ABC transporter permease [Flavobacteriaceae bacterium]|nr:ABC transporter permease [Flavobacteriaceae bacterium]HBS12461.1 ABC transporter permease [Flavobacteriaceae bacterium]